MEKCSKKISRKVGKTHEPYRVYLRPLRDKMRITHRSIEQHLVRKKPLNKKKLLSSREEILKPLRVVRESLEQNKNENIASGELLDLMRRKIKKKRITRKIFKREKRRRFKQRLNIKIRKF